uniref:F-box/LRR-repeat protein 25-like n=1 Tax=Erigeron canadensis TaxID=72917 RepID=UPI001CB98D3A|nr:F-box/LRR-repeat protein 25-like [Erigeron canadensis]
MDFDHKNVRLVLNEDRVSGLPDELIHHILSCIDDTKFVVQTCLLLSPRWQLLWKSLPRLSFSSGSFPTLPKFSKFVTNALSRRNNHVEVSSVKLKYIGAASQAFVKKIANYAFSHNVQELIVKSWPKNHYDYPPCLFSSTSLKHFTFSSFLIRSDLTPKIPKTPWNFPALTTLGLSDITLCEDKREYLDLFSKCVNLKNLYLNCFIVEAKQLDLLKCRVVDPDERPDAYKVNVSTEARNFLLGNSPGATLITDIHEEPPTKAMIAKQAREKKRAKAIADI